MSGLAGFVRLDGAPAQREDLDAMLAAMPHRTRAGAGVWIEGPVALAQLGPPTVPGSEAETEPARRDDVVLAGDVRLDDRPAVLSALGLAPDDEPGDLGLAAAAFARWGAGAPARLDGDFALVAWDPVRRVLVCARDRFGTRPFVYHRGPRLFVFASQPSGVLAHPGVPRRVSDRAIAGFLLEQVPDERATFFEDVERLPPAHVAHGGGGGAERAVAVLVGRRRGGARVERRGVRGRLPPALHRRGARADALVAAGGVRPVRRTRLHVGGGRGARVDAVGGAPHLQRGLRRSGRGRAMVPRRGGGRAGRQRRWCWRVPTSTWISMRSPRRTRRTRSAAG